MEAVTGGPLLRIGELSRRVGGSDHPLRAWESRHGLLQLVRSPGGLRLYSESEESPICTMQAYKPEGLSVAEAARQPRPARPGRGRRHAADRGHGGRPADGGRPGDRG